MHRDQDGLRTSAHNAWSAAWCRCFVIVFFCGAILTLTTGTRTIGVPAATEEPMGGHGHTTEAHLENDNPLLSDAERLRSEWKEASLRAALRKYQSAIAHFRSKRDKAGEVRALLGLGEVLAILGEHDDALKHYRRAWKIAQTSRESKLEVDILNRLTDIEIEKGSKGHEAHAQRAFDLADRAGYQIGRAWALKNLGVIAAINGDTANAEDLLNRSLSLWKSEGNPAGQAAALTNLGFVHGESGRVREADDNFREARLLAAQAGDKQKEARAALAIALGHVVRTEWQSALDLYQAAVNALKQIGDKETLTIGLNGLGELYDELGDPDQALANFNESLQLSRRMGLRGREALIHGHIGRIYAAMGRDQEALSAYRKRIRFARLLRDKKSEAYGLNDSGHVYESLGKPAQALQHYKQAVAISRTLTHRRVLGLSLDNLGTLYRRQDKHKEADAHYHEALSVMKEAGDLTGEAQIRYNIACLKRDRGQIDDALRDIQGIIQGAESQRSNVISSDLRASYFASVYRNHELLIDLLMQKHRRDPGAKYDLAALEASERARARSLIEMLIEARAEIREGVPAELIERELGLSKQFSKSAARELELREEKFELQNSRRKKGEDRREAFAKNSREIEAVRGQMTELIAQLEQVTADIRAVSPEKYNALLQPRVVALKELQDKLLDDDTLVLEYSLGEERSYVWVVGRTFLNSYVLPAGKEQVERLAARFYKALVSLATAKTNPNGTRNPTNVKELAAARDQLSRTLFEPIADIIGSKRLVIVPDGPLHYVPFAALKEPGTDDPLVKNHELAILPSLSVLLELQEEISNRPPALKTLAVIADPVVEKGDPRLVESIARLSPTSGSERVERGISTASGSDRRGRPRRSVGVRRGLSILDAARSPLSSLAATDEATNIVRLVFAREEARMLADLLPESDQTLWMGFDANRKTATSDELSRYRIIHFATHGLLDFRYPKLSCLLLSRFDETGQRQDGALRLQDIYKMKLSADLVVLSACQTALGKEVRGEGLVSLTRGFMYAGAPRVVASLWNIDDVASAELMKRFYKKMLGAEKLRPAAALRAAQIEMMQEDRWQDPYYWAAFILQGDWK